MPHNNIRIFIVLYRFVFVLNFYFFLLCFFFNFVFILFCLSFYFLFVFISFYHHLFCFFNVFPFHIIFSSIELFHLINVPKSQVYEYNKLHWIELNSISIHCIHSNYSPLDKFLTAQKTSPTHVLLPTNPPPARRLTDGGMMERMIEMIG